MRDILDVQILIRFTLAHENFFANIELSRSTVDQNQLTVFFFYTERKKVSLKYLIIIYFVRLSK